MVFSSGQCQKLADHIGEGPRVRVVVTLQQQPDAGKGMIDRASSTDPVSDIR